MSKDLFSAQSKEYALYRPVYPQELFDYIISFAEERKFAWDCATGNGQAALQLSQYFEKVMASDISEKQLKEAPAKNNIEYLISPAEKTPFPDDSFDLITVAQAYHWFDHQQFIKEAIRVGKNNGIIAIWMYDLVQSKEHQLNELIDFFYKNITGPYWDKERKHIDDHYSSLPFPFKTLPSKKLDVTVSYTKEQFTGYFSTWSAVQHFIKQKGYSPLKDIEKQLNDIWQDNETKTFNFPIYLFIGRIKK